MPALEIASPRRSAAGLAVLAALVTAGLIAAAPPAHAGCVYGGGVISKCDGPLQPDGTWQRCVAVAALVPRGASSFLAPQKHCDVMGPEQRPGDLGLADPHVHIDD